MARKQPALMFGLGKVLPQVRDIRRDDEEAIDPLEREALSVLRARRIRELMGEAAPAAMPAPATVQDTIALSREAREAAKETAELARRQAEEERDRRREAEERAEQAYQAGQQEAEGRWSTVLEMFKQLNQTVLTLTKERYETEIRSKESQFTESLKRLEERMDLLLKSKDEEIQRLRQQAQQAAGKRDIREWLVDTLLNPDADPRERDMAHRLVGVQQSPPDLAYVDPDKAVMAKLVDPLVEHNAEQMRIQRERQKRKAEVEERREEASIELRKKLAELLSAGTGFLREAFRGANDQPLPANGLPATWEEGEGPTMPEAGGSPEVQ